MESETPLTSPWPPAATQVLGFFSDTTTKMLSIDMLMIMGHLNGALVDNVVIVNVGCTLNMFITAVSCIKNFLTCNGSHESNAYSLCVSVYVYDACSFSH